MAPDPARSDPPVRSVRITEIDAGLSPSIIRQILDERTKRLAGRATLEAATLDTATPPMLDQMLVCAIAAERYGFPVEAVAEVLPARPVIPLPGAPPAIIGIFGRGGGVVGVLDGALALGAAAPTAHPRNGHFVLLRQRRPRLAVRVDRALGVAPAKIIERFAPSPLEGSMAVTGFARSPAGRFEQSETLLTIVDVAQLLRTFAPRGRLPEPK